MPSPKFFSNAFFSLSTTGSAIAAAFFETDFLAGTFFVAIFLSVVDYFISNNTLSLAFPWRSSVILIPLSTTIILSFLLSKISLENKTLKLVSIVFFVLSCFFFFIKNHYIKNSNKDFNKNLELVKKINKNYDSIERILIPDNLTYIRMNTGLPIFIDWKHHAFKYEEIIFGYIGEILLMMML